MSGHTPGPWHWDAEWKQIRAGEDVIVETDSGYYPPHGGDRALIAAAPELLRELQHLAAILHPWIESGNSVPGIATLNDAFAAIAKATA